MSFGSIVPCHSVFLADVSPVPNIASKVENAYVIFLLTAFSLLLAQAEADVRIQVGMQNPTHTRDFWLRANFLDFFGTVAGTKLCFFYHYLTAKDHLLILTDGFTV